ncbi:hypothetical protein K439DRAFT_516835 [Ramaria rubella]|nr:hypothetical protein K439DRAFT_516835 [Ramaria rubella]
MASIPSFQNLKFDNSLGALLIGLLVSTTLFGLTTLQSYLYFVNYAKDRAAFKWLVGVLWWENTIKSTMTKSNTISKGT